MIFTNLQFMPQVLNWVGIRTLWWGTPPVYSILVKECFCLILCPDQTSHEEMVWWTKSNFLGLLPECGKDRWDCNIVNIIKIVFQFQLLTW